MSPVRADYTPITGKYNQTSLCTYITYSAIDKWQRNEISVHLETKIIRNEF